MKKLIIGLLVIGLLVVSGCVPSSSPPVSIPNELPPANSESTTPVPSEPEPEPSKPTSSEPVVFPDEPPEDRTWISPGKVQVGNFYPGARAEWDLLVHNGKDTPASFLVTYRYPNHVADGYVKPIEEVQNWVIIADSTPVIAPKETREILIVLAMPKDAVVFAPKWEFWVSVKDTTQKGMVQTELASRWLIVMR